MSTLMILTLHFGNIFAKEHLESRMDYRLSLPELPSSFIAKAFHQVQTSLPLDILTDG